MKEIKSVAIVGVGRVANHIATTLYSEGLEISAVYGRKTELAQALAKKVEARVITDISKPIRADLILLVVSDDAIEEVGKQLSKSNKGIVAHTSGAVPMAELPADLRRGVFYPLQSFSIGKKIIWANVPFCIEAENDEDLNALGDLAEKISTKVYVLSSEQRKILHLAAIFANNFANLMYEFSDELLEDAGIDREIMHPLILETANKILMQRASESQTGPASRGDLDTIRMHREILGEDNIYRKVYDLLTTEIYNRNHDQKL